MVCLVEQDERWRRRLAPDCSRIDLAMFPKEKEESKLLYAMGWETANLHIGSGKRRQLLADVRRRKDNWLHKAAVSMVAATKSDWQEWRGRAETAKVKAAAAL